MDQIQLLAKKNDIQRFISLMDESVFSKLENHLIEANYEVDVDGKTSTIDENLLSEVMSSNDTESLITEEVKDKIKVIFTAAVNEKVQEKVREIQESMDNFFTENQGSVDAYAEYVKQELESENEEKQTTLEEKLDSYLDYVITEWVEENKIALESGVRNQISESVISGLKKLFESNYINVPEEPITLMGELEEKSKKLYETNVDLNSQVKTLNKKVSDLNKKLILETCSSDLSGLDKDRLASLAESIKAKTVEEFKKQVNILKESLISKNTINDNRDNVSVTQLNEGKAVTQEKETSNVDPKIQSYLDVIEKMNPKKSFSEKK